MTQELQSPYLLLDSLRQVTKTRPRLCSKARIPEGAQVGPVHMFLVLITGEICVYKVLWKSLSIWTVSDVIKNSLSYEILIFQCTFYSHQIKPLIVRLILHWVSLLFAKKPRISRFFNLKMTNDITLCFESIHSIYFCIYLIRLYLLEFSTTLVTAIKAIT